MPRAIPKAKREEALRMYRAGEKGTYIAYVLGIAPTTVNKIAIGAGLLRGRGTRIKRPVTLPKRF